MNTDFQQNIKPDNFRCNSEIDSQISELLHRECLTANENLWFTRRVMNKLPERNRHAGLSLLQLGVYLVGFVALIVACITAGRLFIESNCAPSTFIAIISISFTIIICGGMITIPALLRILREP